MAAPEGYKELAVVGIVWKGDWSEEAQYTKYNMVYYDGSSFIALIDEPSGPPSHDGVNWQLAQRGVGAIFREDETINIDPESEDPGGEE